MDSPENPSANRALFGRPGLDFFAIGWSVFSAGYLTAITFLPIPEENLRFADMFSGFLLGTVISSLIQYRYGSSVSSRVKDETIATQLPGGRNE